MQIKPRLIELPSDESIFLFGARNTGKSTLIKKIYPESSRLLLDLLDPMLEDTLARNPHELAEIVQAQPDAVTHIILDEIQKIPKLLDVVHNLIENTNKKFILTGSSARKLKAGGANLLAGRALVYELFPFSFLEIKKDFNLQNTLSLGLLPTILENKIFNAKKKFLQTYALTYLKEEVWAEQIVKNLDPFRKFLEVAAQCNGKLINYSNIARDVGVDDKTVANYYTILEDTLIGFHLHGFQHSFRKRLSTKPKFYFFDIGVTRALARMLSTEPTPGTSYYGELFEHLVILECYKLSSYSNNEFKFSYLQTKDDAEIDLVVDRPGKPLLFIEIKSATNITEKHLSNLKKIAHDFGACEAICLANVPRAKVIDNIKVLPWQPGIKEYFYSRL